MSEFFGSVWWLIVSLGVLVTFHEFGHFWVARRCGVKVLRFSVGFGRPLWMRRGRDGTEYAVAALPLGGYVRMLDEREGEVDPQDAHAAFNRKSVWQRIAIVAAGPLANLALCIALLWAMFLVGKGDYQPIVGRADGVAASAGLQPDDRLLRIDGQPIETWTHAGMALTTAALDRRPVTLDIDRPGDGPRTLRLDLGALGETVDERVVLREIGLVPTQLLLPAVIGAVRPGSPADRAALQPDDRILAVDGTALRSWDGLSDALQQAGGEAVVLRVQRGDDTLIRTVQPEALAQASGPTRWIIGVEARRSAAAHDALLRYDPIDAVGAALHETWRLTDATLGLLTRMVTGSASLQNISGPISIAQYANSSAQMGTAWFLFFLAVLSLSLAIMNLLPVPILDGGHLLYYLIELVKGSPVSERTMVAGQYVGLAFLAGLMGLAFYNDILRLVSG